MIWHTPASATVTANPIIQKVNASIAWSPWDLLNYETLSYQSIVDFIWELAYGNSLESLLSAEQLSQVMDFVIFLTRNGLQDDDIEGKAALEEDIKWLRGEPNQSMLALDDDESSEVSDESWWWPASSSSTALNGYNCKINPAVLDPFDNLSIIHCSWASKAWKSTKKFVKNHKKVIIVAAVVVVATTIIIVATSGAGAAPALEGGGAAIGGALTADKRDKNNTEPIPGPKPRTPVNKPGEVYVHDNPEEYNHLSITPDSTQGHIASGLIPQLEPIPDRSILLKDSIARQSTILKEELSENTIIPDEPLNILTQEQPSFWCQSVDRSREVGSIIVHEVYDGIADQLSIIPSITGYVSEKVNNFSEFLSENSPFEGSPIDNYQSSVNTVHEKIDESFGTNHANIYSQEGKAARGGLTTGMLPPPGTIKGTQPNSTKGWKVGQPKENLTAKGNVPKWDTIRARHWKNEALKHRQGIPKENLKYEVTEANLARMEKGLAPQKYNERTQKWESIELHHDPARKDGGLFDVIEVTPKEHAEIDSNRHLGRS